MKVLIVEDNVVLSKNIAKFLKFNWINSETEFDWERAFGKILQNHYDLIILDINLPKMDGLTISNKLREKQKNIPILMLTSRTTKKDVVEWLYSWADDYLWKPFDMDELLARLEALYRRSAVDKNSSIKINDIIVDIKKRKVYKSLEEIYLSTLEFNLLKYLAQYRWHPIDRKTLLENVWGEFEWNKMFSRSVDMYIGYLRKKFGKDFIKTKKWYWYVIE